MSAVSRLSHGRVVALLTVLVLAFSGAALALALTRDEPTAAALPPGVSPDYAPADFPGSQGEALRAAVAAMPQLLSYDHRRLGADLRDDAEVSTPGFARRFDATVRRDVVPLARRDKRVSVGEVVAAGISAVDGDRVVVLAYVDQRLVEATSLPANGRTRVTRSRLLVTMVERDGAWKVDGLRVI